MDDSGRVSSRREFLGYGLVAAGALMAGGLDALAQEKTWGQLQRYREQLFGRERFAWYARFFGKNPVLVDGDLERLSYKLYEKDKRAFGDIVSEAGIFLGGEHRGDYDVVYGREAAHYWKKDRNKVVASLLKVINVPDYTLHDYIRRKLREDGILDFQAHKKNVDRFVDQRLGGLVKICNKYVVVDAAKRKFREMVHEETGKAAMGLKLLYLATLPINSLRTYRKIDEDIDKILDEGFEALDNAQNIEEGMANNNNVEVAHQTKELIGRFKDLFNMMGGLINPDSITRTEVDVKMGTRRKVYPFSERKEPVYWFDYLVEEWDDLNFDGWKGTLEGKVDKALAR